MLGCIWLISMASPVILPPLTHLTNMITIWAPRVGFKGIVTMCYCITRCLSLCAHCAITVAGPLSNLPRAATMHTISLEQNKLSGEAAAQGLHPSLHTNARPSLFPGSLPPSWSVMTRLQRVSLYSNQITGMTFLHTLPCFLKQH